MNKTLIMNVYDIKDEGEILIFLFYNIGVELIEHDKILVICNIILKKAVYSLRKDARSIDSFEQLFKLLLNISTLPPIVWSTYAITVAWCGLSYL